jgi:hypothetical protein
MEKQRHFRKDESLDRLARLINVAQFVSFSPLPELRQQYSRVLGFPPNHSFENLRVAVSALMNGSPEGSLNVRSFLPEDPRSKEFVYGLKSVSEVESAVERIAGQGLYVIVNETVDVNDGGVSGVVLGDAIEFAPDDTPRCVEKPGVASLPRIWGIRMLEQIYGFPLRLGAKRNVRLEFSIHPKPRGWKKTHILGWELESIGSTDVKPTLAWPNKFSRFIGDKAYGLLVADLAGLPVPRTLVISRRVSPFSFGRATGSHERWIRTCPTEQVAGKFTTHHGWIDPFKLMANEDPSGRFIASVLDQNAVPAEYSGAAIVGDKGIVVVEGKRGEGEVFMKGEALPEQLPKRINVDVIRLYAKAAEKLGPVRFEWVHDGNRAWIVQLHRGATTSSATVIVPGQAKRWRNFEVILGLEKLRTELETLDEQEGIVLLGQVGLTSHIADVVRKAGRPARIAA